MELFESLFDVAYLVMVVALGVRLLLEDAEGAKLFGIMAILLGLGDSFHLLPRIMSHLNPEGFEAYESALSWGQFVTSITMTIFYLLYYYYYKRISESNSKGKDILMYGLVIARIVLILLPQNEWGQMPGNFTFGIIRNIPFAILGILLIIWSWQDRNKPGLKYMAELIFFSFLFYIPVVLWANVVPAIGALMMPKTVAYLLLVIVGYRYFIKEFKSVNILNISFVYLVMGLAAGVFCREFTKFNSFYDKTTLGILHVHSIVVGFISLLLLWSILRNIDTTELIKKFKRPILSWTGGLYFTIVTMIVRGISQIVGEGYLPFPDTILAGIAGGGHLILGVSIVWIILELIKREKRNIKLVK